MATTTERRGEERAQSPGEPRPPQHNNLTRPGIGRDRHPAQHAPTMRHAPHSRRGVEEESRGGPERRTDGNATADRGRVRRGARGRQRCAAPNGHSNANGDAPTSPPRAPVADRRRGLPEGPRGPGTQGAASAYLPWPAHESGWPTSRGPSAASTTFIISTTFSSSQRRPTTCTPTGMPAILSAS